MYLARAALKRRLSRTYFGVGGGGDPPLSHNKKTDEQTSVERVKDKRLLFFFYEYHIIKVTQVMTFYLVTPVKSLTYGEVWHVKNGGYVVLRKE